MGERSLKSLMCNIHDDWNGVLPKRVARNTLKYGLKNGDTVYQYHNTVLVRHNVHKTVVYLYSGGWNTSTTTNRINRAMRFVVSGHDAPLVYSYSGILYYAIRLVPVYRKFCVFEFENGMKLNRVRGLYIPNTEEVLRYCGIARSRRVRAREMW